MSRPSDDRLVAYLDGEITGAERREIEAWLESEPDARSRLAALAESAELLREAYADVLREAVPDRLIAAARGTTLGPQTGARRSAAWRVAARAGRSRWWVALPIAASLCGFVAGGGATYFGILHGLAPGLGAGASWFVRSKLARTGQVFATLLNTFPRPIPAPVANLRPARETCEQCHWPQRYTGDKVVVHTQYAEDEMNSVTDTVLLMKIGGKAW